MALNKKELVDKLATNAADRSPLLRAQKETYLETQAKADKYNNVSQYMFWGATSLMFGIITTAIGGLGSGTLGTMMAGSVFGVGVPVLFGLAGAAAVGLAIGNIMYSSKSREAAEKANVLYSDIDSQQQSHRMVQAFAKAQVQGKVHEDNNPYAGTPGTSWAERVGNGRATAQNTWADKIAAEAQAEEATMLAGASR